MAGDESAELGLLRALWRMSKGAIAEGAIADLDALPPGLGGSQVATPMLDALQDRQFLVWSRVGEGIVVADRAAPISRWPIDWETLERRRGAEFAQLEMMQKYAYTDRCRRGFVLRYFGDPSASAKCDQCDNCLHLGHQATPAEAAPAGPSRKTAAKTKKAKTAAVEIADLTEEQGALLDRLRAWRTTVSKRDAVPAYVVFADRTLRELARARPSSPGKLMDVPGIGPAKMDKYGEDILRLLHEG
jgi:ATP-dependent DNA helicase RecQ